MTLLDINSLAKAYAERRRLLADRLTALERDLNAIKAKHMKELKRHVALTAETASDLHNAIDDARDLFRKPKTQILHGIKVGLRKGVGKLDWEDDEDVVAKIEKHFKDADEAAQYLIVKKKPSADALEDLDAATLKKFAIVVVDTGEQVVVKAVESDVEKLIKALLKGATDEETES